MNHLTCLEPAIKVEPPTYLSFSFNEPSKLTKFVENKPFIQTNTFLNTPSPLNEKIVKVSQEKKQKHKKEDIQNDVWNDLHKVTKKKSKSKREQPTFMIHVIKKSGNLTTEEVTFQNNDKSAKKKWSKINLE